MIADSPRNPSSSDRMSAFMAMAATTSLAGCSGRVRRIADPQAETERCGGDDGHDRVERDDGCDSGGPGDRPPGCGGGGPDDGGDADADEDPVDDRSVRLGGLGAGGEQAGECGDRDGGWLVHPVAANESFRLGHGQSVAVLAVHRGVIGRRCPGFCPATPGRRPGHPLIMPEPGRRVRAGCRRVDGPGWPVTVGDGSSRWAGRRAAAGSVSSVPASAASTSASSSARGSVGLEGVVARRAGGGVVTAVGVAGRWSTWRPG